MILQVVLVWFVLVFFFCAHLINRKVVSNGKMISKSVSKQILLFPNCLKPSANTVKPSGYCFFDPVAITYLFV